MMIDTLVRDWLRNWPGLQDACPIEISSDVPSIPVVPWISIAQVSRFTPSDLDASAGIPCVARVQIDVWGERSEQVDRLADEVELSLLALDPTAHPVIQGVEIENSFRSSAETNSTSPRSTDRIIIEAIVACHSRSQLS
jgi:hypothetical protein